MNHLSKYTSVKIKALFICSFSSCYCAIVFVVVVCLNFFSIYVVALLPCRQQGIIINCPIRQTCVLLVVLFSNLFVCLFVFVQIRVTSRSMCLLHKATDPNSAQILY